MKNRYMTPLGWYWFLQRPAFRAFMAREATSVAVAGYLVFVLILLNAIGDGPVAYDRVVVNLKQPLAVFGHVLVFGAALYLNGIPSLARCLRRRPVGRHPVVMSQRRTLKDNALYPGS